MQNKKVLLPFRYPGGKYYALKYLRPFWETIEHDEYREPFLGGGSVFWAKEMVKYNWLNDIDTNLISTLEVIRDDLEHLLPLFANENEATREHYEQVKSSAPQNKLERAFKYYYLNRTSFSGKMRNPTWGYRPKRSLPPRRWQERLIPVSEKLQEVKLTSTDFADIICAPSVGQKVLMFLDPPYFKANQKSHYACPFEINDHKRLLEVLLETKYNFFLTYDDCEEIRVMYKWANIYPLKFVYRLDNSADNDGKRSNGNEIIITNFKMNL